MKAILITMCIFFNANAWAKSYANINKNGVLIEEYDPVAYFPTEGADKKISPGKAVKGKAEFQVKRDEGIYYFSTAENKALFEKTPEKYTPAFGGWCAYAVADSKQKVEIDPKSFVIQDDRLLLFYNGFFADTRKTWTTDQKKTQQEYLIQADANWSETKNKEP